MELLILLAMGFELAISLPLILAGGRALRRHPEGAEPPGGWPAVSMVVPVGGIGPITRPALESLLTQEYPDLEVIFSAQEEHLPVRVLLDELIQRHPHAKFILTDRARTCGQKNHNLLAGLGEVRAPTKILVFCDSTHIAPAGFLKALVSPIATRKARVTSGYHHVEPKDGGFIATGRAVTVLTLYLTKALRSLNQPWGGATAIERRLFQDLDVGDLWASTVVDDVTLAKRLAQAKVWTALSHGAWVSTPVIRDTFVDYADWLTRQWLFLKFVFPVGWLVAGFNQYLLCATTLYALLAIPCLPLGWVPLSQGVAGLVFFIVASLIALRLRGLHPGPSAPGTWVVASILSALVSAWCHMRSLFTWTLRWGGVTYRVGLGGRVKRVDRE